jgi:hypothetical protein
LHGFPKRSLWYQHRVRALFAAVTLFAAACGAHPGPPAGPSSTSSDPPVQVNPARIDRVRGGLPHGYEVVDVAGRIAPAGAWGYRPEWTAEPPQCGALANPVPEPATANGWSGSGPGGIVYAVVAGSPGEQMRLDPTVIADCGHWTLSGGQTNGTVTLTPAPAIEGATAVAMTTVSTTVVEGGTETRSHADTLTAYLDHYVAFVAVVTDPGSPNPQLGQDFAAELMVKTVSALRG